MLFVISESKLFENSCSTENHFWAAPSSVVCINAVVYVSNFDGVVYELVRVLYLKLNLLLLHLNNLLQNIQGLFL